MAKTNTRITVDIPTVDHKKLKMLAAYHGKSMRQIFIELIEHGLEHYKECPENHTPNEVTKKALDSVKERKSLKKAATVEELKEIFLTESSSKLIIKQNVISVTDEKIIRAMSYNIRMAPFAEDDNNENAWIHRLPKINMIFDQYQPDIIGIQEMSSLQMYGLQNSQYLRYQFIGRCPTKQPIESGLGIAYNTQKIHLISKLHTIWLNESQTQANASAWDGSCYERYAIYAKFKSIKTGKDFWFITTHFDHVGIKARQESAKIIMNLAESLDAPAIVTGDFNCFPEQGGPELYQLLCTHSKKMKDSGTIADLIFGVPGSWIGWDYDMYKQRGKITSKYDFVFVDDTIKVIQHGIIDDTVWDKQFHKALYPSDHRPVISDLIFKLDDKTTSTR